MRLVGCLLKQDIVENLENYRIKKTFWINSFFSQKGFHRRLKLIFLAGQTNSPKSPKIDSLNIIFSLELWLFEKLTLRPDKIKAAGRNNYHS